MPLPADHRATLSTIAKALRNVPREAIHDPPELFVWLNRQAKALERARDMPMPAPTSPQASPRLSAPTPPPHVLSARERAEAVFNGSLAPMPGETSALLSPPMSGEAMFRVSSGVPPRPRIVMDRKGRGVRVEVRTARACGDLFEGPYG